MKTISATVKWDASTRRCWVNGEKISASLSQKIRNHSPDGFSSGYGGSGPSQLALAICLKITGSSEAALSIYQDFKWKYVSHWDKNFEGQVELKTDGENWYLE